MGISSAAGQPDQACAIMPAANSTVRPPPLRDVGPPRRRSPVRCRMAESAPDTLTPSLGKPRVPVDMSQTREQGPNVRAGDDLGEWV